MIDKQHTTSDIPFLRSTESLGFLGILVQVVGRGGCARYLEKRLPLRARSVATAGYGIYSGLREMVECEPFYRRPCSTPRRKFGHLKGMAPACPGQP